MQHAAYTTIKPKGDNDPTPEIQWPNPPNTPLHYCLRVSWSMAVTSCYVAELLNRTRALQCSGPSVSCFWRVDPNTHSYLLERWKAFVKEKSSWLVVFASQRNAYVLKWHHVLVNIKTHIVKSLAKFDLNEVSRVPKVCTSFSFIDLLRDWASLSCR